LAIAMKNGKIVYRCYAGCTFEQIDSALRARGIDAFTAGPVDLAPEERRRLIELATRNPVKSREEEEEEKFLAAHVYRPRGEGEWWTDPRAIRRSGRSYKTTTFLYRDLDGYPLMAVHRLDKIDPTAPGKRKIMVPITPWAQIHDNRLVLPTRTSPTPRLPYGAETLGRPGTAWIVEGEKCRDALDALLQQKFPVLSFYGSSPRDADLAHLRERDSIVLPDFDDPGRRFADEVGNLLGDRNAQMSSTWRGPAKSTPPKGWDIADDVLGASPPGKPAFAPLTTGEFVRHAVTTMLNEKRPIWERIIRRAVAELRMRVG
jgi:5S rRNA maturation endonuclease (ribonuclease M5)